MVYGQSFSAHLDILKEYPNYLIIMLFYFICFIKKKQRNEVKGSLTN